MFEPHGALARALPGFEARPGQREMADAVAAVFAEGGVLLAEAATGTGKTLAYLVPAILSRRRVLVSTGTKNLQEQIFFKDLPVLRTALGFPFRATYMKGRGNYLCLHRFDSFREATPSGPTDRIYLALLEEWASRTETGDRAEMEDLPEDVPFWNDISATNENCIGTDCPRYQDCFVTRMRQQAAESDLVIVNHHLLCADAAVRQSSFGEVIPDCSLAIVDEAHQLEDVATQYFGISVSNYRIDELVRDAWRIIGLDLSDDDRARKQLGEAIDRVRECSTLFFSALALVKMSRTFGGAGAHGTVASAPRRDEDDRIRIGSQLLEPVNEPGREVAGALDNLSAAIALLREATEDLKSLGARATALREQLEFLLRASDEDYVYFLELRGRGVFLRASPIDVSKIVREFLLDRREATVLTSATLTVGGSFAYVRRRLGARSARELRLPGEFDYARQAILYLPRRMPDPRGPGFVAAAAREIQAVVRRTRGRAFVLFTSYANLREAYRMLATELEYPLLVQGTAPRTALLHEFRSTPHAVLFATASFWQGVDVVGEALSCVIIDKLPFASPADPITAARVEAIRSHGGEPFEEYQVPLAILTLLQGLGRLIRHRADRGVLAILDPRLRTQRYGRQFLASLPPAPVTSDLDDIDLFFAAPRP